jgi:hypothetical protein
MNDWQRYHLQVYPTPPDDPRLKSALPCPFCNSPRLAIARLQNYIHCNSCGADGPETRPTKSEGGYHAAVREWNRRGHRIEPPR